MKRMQQGFTLIELMIVVAIIGILAAIALPQYQTYIAKSQVSRVMGEAGNYKTAVDQCILNGRTTGDIHSNLPANQNPDAGDCVLDATSSSLLEGDEQGDGAAPAAGTGYVQVANDAGVWTIVGTFGNGAAASLQVANDNTLTWSRDVNGTWTCTTTVQGKYAPNGCTVN